MKKLILIVFLSLAGVGFLQGQFTFQNPSFEGTSQAHVVPGPWNACFGSPDTQPGQWGITTPPTNGNTYISFLAQGSGGYVEGVSQQLSGCMTAGVQYTFNIDIAFSGVYNTAEPGNCYGSLAIWGSNSNCGQNQMLWSSGPITQTGWNTYTITFTPTQNWCRVTFAPYVITPCSGYINSMVDNITPIVPAGPVLNITSPTANANMACGFTVTGTHAPQPTSVTLYGNFTGSPLNATILNGTNWQAQVDYPDNLSGPQTIIAVGQFANNVTKSDTVTFNLIDINPNFTATTVCAGTPTNFTSTSTITAPGTITGYNWTFLPGQTSTLQNPSYTFANPGTYNVQLITTSNAGCSDTTVLPVTVLPSVNADFTFTSGCLNTAAVFTDASASPGGTVNQWNWNFGDGSGTSTQQNPSYTYSTAGAFNVRLITQPGSACADTVTKQVVIDPLPVAAFTGLPSTGCTPLSVSLNSSTSTVSTGSIVGWEWDFGDGVGTSTQQNPSYTFTTAGTYTVRLITRSSAGCKDTTTQQIVVVSSVNANFSHIAGCLGVAANFTDFSTSAGGVSQWSWDFGDGVGTSTAQNPSYTYTAAGTYTATLIAEPNSTCADTTTFNVVVDPRPTAAFSGLPTAGCAALAVNLSDQSTGNGGTVTVWNWDFGDSNTSTTQNPAHTFSGPGTFTVTLIAETNAGCTDTVTAQVAVAPDIIADFSFSSGCLGFATTFTDLSNSPGGSISSWSWDFGDGTGTSTLQNPSYSYAAAGTYTVTLISNPSNACADTVSKAIIVEPKPTASFSGLPATICTPGPVTLADLSTGNGANVTNWNWNFGDGNTSTTQNPTHTYTVGGNYTVQLISGNAAGCTDTLTQQIVVYPGIVADFASTAGCFGVPATMQDQSATAGTVGQWAWDFGDGIGTSALQNPTYTYTAAGNYTLTLIVTTIDGCADTIAKPITVDPKPVADFIGTPTAGCEPLTVRFTDQSNANGGVLASWKWTFGDGNTDNLQNPTNIYESAGSYTVTLVITSQNNCKDTLVLPNYITVNPQVVADFVASPTTVDEFNPLVTLTDFSTGGPDSWFWNLGNGTTSTTQNGTVLYPDSGTYTIMLVANNAFNCPDTAYANVRVNPLSTFYIPNAFTPDGDGVNDYFGGVGLNLKKYEMLIFNRWGQLLYQTDDQLKPWDGGYKDTNTVLIDSYIYQFNVVDILGAKKTYRGTVAVIR